ncbi:hypothetical protein ANCCAN_28140 [Ancylostoma caninum]|uniref:Uncharacterized protein n=1 Tax=Ancylostoma caninum TaxID=29170 RepID=A0A368F571_ANCCA|nr:hypothetical protein ANCCAN_28140 [Ancylostoma caninum]
MRKTEAEEKRANPYSGPEILDVTISTCTPCPNCRTMIYDEEIMSGWKVDDQNLNTICPYCSSEEADHGSERKGVFAPRLTVHMEWRDRPTASWYKPSSFEADAECNANESYPETEDVSVSYVSPLVLRREVETLLASDLHALKDPKIMSTHPVVFWNLIFYLRRLSLPTHLYTWISPRNHVRCVYDRPLDHSGPTPLYLVNPNHKFIASEKVASRSLGVWRTVTQSVQDNKLFTAIQTLINDSRRVTENGQIALGPHFPVFRDIQFASLDMFGRALLRDSLDKQYAEEHSKLPPRIMCIMPQQDRPQSLVQRACRKVFLPLDLF